MKKIKSRTLLIPVFLLVFIALGIILANGRNSYNLNLFRSGDGWGYDILKKDMIVIHQPFIPAMDGEAPFMNKQMARKTGRLVLKKIRKQEIPAVTREEIIEILNKR